MIHREAPHGWHFSKWGMMPVKNSHQWCASRRRPCFLIRACRFAALLCLGVVIKGRVWFWLFRSPFITASFLPFLLILRSPSSSPAPRLSHWSLSSAYLYSYLNFSLSSFSLVSSPSCFLKRCHLSWEDTHASWYTVYELGNQDTFSLHILSIFKWRCSSSVKCAVTSYDPRVFLCLIQILPMLDCHIMTVIMSEEIPWILYWDSPSLVLPEKGIIEEMRLKHAFPIVCKFMTLFDSGQTATSFMWPNKP